MIEDVIKRIENKDEILIIYDIGSSDCIPSIELYKQFPNSKIYVFDCNPNTVELCRRNIEPYSDRITFIEAGAVCNSGGNIDICYINDNDFMFVRDKISLRNVKLVVNNHNILYDNSKKQVVLVSTGVFQTYIKWNIIQLLKFDFNIHVIIDAHFFTDMEEYRHLVNLVNAFDLYTDFDNKSKLDKQYRNGFWNNASKRLFILNEYMKKYGVKNVIHLENDVLLYSDMNYKLDEKIYITMDAGNRCIPGIIYIPNYELFNKLIETYNYSRNDMENLSIFYANNRTIVNTFPIIDNSVVEKNMYNENFDNFNSIFDGAAMGQYLGGVDPRNIPGDTTGFVNETCVIKYDKYKFKWLKKGTYYLPHIEINNNMILINNLHIHSKNLEQFSIDNPIQNKFIDR